MISLVVPIYNSEKYLRECIDSILNQNFRNFELILVDDGSLDGSLNICRGYSDDRIKIIKKKNGGVSSARNAGISIAQGEYITFVDSDDTLPKDALSKLYNAILETDADMVSGSYCLQYGNHKIPHSQRLQSGKYDIKSLLPDFIDDGTLSGFLLGSVCGNLYKTRILKKYSLSFNQNIRNNEDGLFNLEYAFNAGSLCVIKDNVYYYRQQDDSASKKGIAKETNEQLENYIYTINEDRIPNLTIQFKRRKVSIALWNILACTSHHKAKSRIHYICSYICDADTVSGIREIQYKKLTCHKKIFYLLIKWKCSWGLYLLVRYAIPTLNKTVRR